MTAKFVLVIITPNGISIEGLRDLTRNEAIEAYQICSFNLQPGEKCYLYERVT